MNDRVRVAKSDRAAMNVLGRQYRSGHDADYHGQYDRSLHLH
jgi:hypothetical protein